VCCIDRYGFVPLADMAPTGRSTAYDYYSSLQGQEEVLSHKILIIKGTKVDLAVRQVGRRGV